MLSIQVDEHEELAGRTQSSCKPRPTNTAHAILHVQKRMNKSAWRAGYKKISKTIVTIPVVEHIVS